MGNDKTDFQRSEIRATAAGKQKTLNHKGAKDAKTFILLGIRMEYS